MDYLIEGVTNRDFPDRPDMLPRQNRMGFPCASLECFAVAMLEVVPDNAECALDVTDLVKRGDVYCFDDLILAQQDGA